MTNRFVPLPRIAAISVAITLFAAPIAAAQSPESAPPVAASPNTVLLSNAAFARVIQAPRTDRDQIPVVTDAPSLDLVRQMKAVMARQTQTAPTRAPQQKSWASRHKVELGFIIAGAIIGFVLMTVAFPE